MVRILPFLSASSLVAVLAGCAPAMMEVRPDLEQAAEVWVVSGHQSRWANSDMVIGPWRVDTVREGWTFAWGLNASGFEMTTAGTPLRFALTELATDPVLVECRWRDTEISKRGWSMDVSDLPRARLRCGIEQSQRRLEMHLMFNGSALVGEISGTGLALAETRQLKGSALGLTHPAGYHFNLGGQALAAVDTLNEGRVYLHPELAGPDRLIVVAASVALMLYSRTLE